MPTIQRILQLAPAASYLAANYVDKKNFLKGGALIPNQSINIYRIYKILKHVYDKDPTYPGLQVRCDYLYELLKRWALAAAAIVDDNNGGSVAPITPSGSFTFDYLIPVLGGVPQFTNATDYDDVRIIGKNLEIFWNDIPRFLVAGEWAYTPTGIRILVAGFDATVNTYDFKIFIRNPFLLSGTGAEVTRPFQFTGTTGTETSITNSLLSGATIVSVSRSTVYEMIYSGTPVGTQVLVNLNASNLSNGTLTFASDNPILVGEVVEITFSKSV